MNVHVVLALDENSTAPFKIVPPLEHLFALLGTLDPAAYPGRVHPTGYVHRVAPNVEVQLRRSDDPGRDVAVVEPEQKPRRHELETVSRNANGAT